MLAFIQKLHLPGARWMMKSTKPMYWRSTLPMMMLGGSPTCVAVPPTLLSIACVICGVQVAQGGGCGGGEGTGFRPGVVLDSVKKG